MRIGKNLIILRHALNRSQKEIAAMAGMSQSNYSKIESDLQEASLEQIEIFARILCVSVPALLQPNLPDQHRQEEPVAGGFSGNAVIEALITAKDQTIEVLRAQLESERQRLLLLKQQNLELVRMLMEKVSVDSSLGV